MNARIAALCLASALASLPLAARAESAYTVEAPPTVARTNVPAAASVVVKPGKGYHFNKDFPTALKLDAVADVDAPTRLTAKDAGVQIEEGGASFDVKLTAHSAGKKALAGTLSFAVCTATTCVPTREHVTLQLDVK